MNNLVGRSWNGFGMMQCTIYEWPLLLESSFVNRELNETEQTELFKVSLESLKILTKYTLYYFMIPALLAPKYYVFILQVYYKYVLYL